MSKNFEFGLVLGRFHHLHKGHMQLIDMTRKISEKTLILISSSQESGTLRNPFEVELRKEMIQQVYPQEDVVIATLPDLTNENDISFDWGRYILKNIEENYGRCPDLMVYGKDESRKGWFSEEDSSQFSEIMVAKDKIRISATQLRKYLVENQKEEWKKYVPCEIWERYEMLREKLLQLTCYQNSLDDGQIINPVENS